MALSTKKAVSSAKLSATKAKQMIPAGTPHAGVILVDTRAKAPTKANTKNGLTSTFVGQSNFAFDLDAGLLVDALTVSLLAWYRDCIRDGTKPDGSGKQKELSPKVKNQQGRASLNRGFKTGFFSDSIRRNKITGTTVKARSVIVPDPRRNVFVASEAKRGNSYFSVEGLASNVITDVTSDFIKNGMNNQNRAVNKSSGTATGQTP